MHETDGRTGLGRIGNRVFFLNIIFFNPNSKYIAQNHFIPTILRRRHTAGRNDPFGSLRAETRLSAVSCPTCMRPGTAAERAPDFRPPAGRKEPFGRLPAETRLHSTTPRPAAPFFLLLPPFFLLPALSFHLEKQSFLPQLISKNSR